MNSKSISRHSVAIAVAPGVAMVTDNERVTTELLWRAAVVFTVLAIAVLPVLVRLVPRERFEKLKLHVVAATFVVWLVIWSAMVIVYWGSVYSFFFPARLRWPLPLLMATGFAAVSFALWQAARRISRWPVVIFVLLGACLGPITHTWAVFRGLLTGPPMLQGVSPLAAIVVSAPEFALYFSVIVGLARLWSALAELSGCNRLGRNL